MPSFRAPRLPRRAADALVVLGVLALSLLQLLLGGGFGDFSEATQAADGWSLALVLLGALALLGRDRLPYVVLAATFAASLALAALGYGVHAPVAPAVALYAIAVRPEPRRAVPVLVVAATCWGALVLIEVAVTPYGVADYLLPGLLWAGAWLVGDRRRYLRAQVADGLEHARREQELVVAEERARIARELHDSAGHAINTILVHAGAARVLRERDPERSAQAVATIEELARETIEEIDRIVGLLREDRDVERAPTPGLDQLPALVERQRAGGLDVRLTVAGETVRAPTTVSLAAYRIAQETLTNASRHGTGSATIAVHLDPDELRLTVENPVVATSATRSGGGRGIAGMRERAKLLGGSLDAGREGARFVVRARLPYSGARR